MDGRELGDDVRRAVNGDDAELVNRAKEIEDLRRRDLSIRGQDLVDTMIRYSERGQAYVDDLKAIMRQNRLDPADDAYLRKMEVIRLVPKFSPEPDSRP